MAGRPWFIGRICELSGPTPADFARVINIDTGDIERIPAPWIVELMGDGGLLNDRHPRQRMLNSRAD
jgi:hypothetical protein